MVMQKATGDHCIKDSNESPQLYSSWLLNKNKTITDHGVHVPRSGREEQPQDYGPPRTLAYTIPKDYKNCAKSQEHVVELIQGLQDNTLKAYTSQEKYIMQQMKW